MAVQAKIAANDSSNPLYMAAGMANVSAGWAAVYLRLGRKGTIMTRRDNPARDEQVLATVANGIRYDSGLLPPKVQECASLDLDVVFAEKPHIRSGDRDVLRYVVEQQNGEALLADIRNKFLLPKSSAWRLVKRLEREELVEITKFGNQNLIRCRRKDDE